jgi:putative hydrolase of HD superfamily
MASYSSEKTLSLLREALLLKKLPRTGWLHVGAPHESIADHSFSTAFVAICLARMEGLSEHEEGQLIRAALLHDLPEVRTGDQNAVTKKYNKTDHARAHHEMFKGTLLYGEPKKGESAKNRLEVLLNDADKLDLLLMAIENERAGNKNMADFIKSAKAQIKSKSGKKLVRLALTRMKK